MFISHSEARESLFKQVLSTDFGFSASKEADRMRDGEKVIGL
jgi:hypothetical protein